MSNVRFEMLRGNWSERDVNLSIPFFAFLISQTIVVLDPLKDVGEEKTSRLIVFQIESIFEVRVRLHTIQS